jgi:hypothetical protein
MAARCHVLAVVTALAGHLVGVVGLPLPVSSPVTTAAPIKEKVQRKCCCACGDGCGPCCCCSGEPQPAAPASDANAPLYWVGSLQLQKCFGIGPTGMPDLPPGLPVERSVGQIHVNSVIGTVHLPPMTVMTVSSRPPTPPPRAV